MELSPEQEESVSTLFELLFAVYDYDAGQVPDDPNEIMELQTSTESRDLLAWEIFKLIRYEIDPSSRPPTEAIEEETVVSFESAQAEGFMEPIESIPIMTLSMESEPAEDLTGPLDSCILESRTYRITQLPLQIEGHVVIPAGTRLIAPYDPNNPVIEVLPGGLLETGGAAFYDTESYPAMLPAVEIVPEDPNIFYNHNFAGIYIHRGADPRTRIENVLIENCAIGILADEALINPIRGVITLGCYDGIHLYAPARIVDCQFTENGSCWIGPFGYVGTGIYVWLNWDDDGPEVVIDRTTVYFADVALYIEGGSTDPNNSDPNRVVPMVNVVNSALTGGLYYGLYQSSGQAAVDVEYCAFGDNHYASNIDLPYTECIGVENDPFYNHPENWMRLYVNPASPLIDAGFGMASDGMGTCHNRPDTGRMDIGCHFPLGISGGFGIPSSPADFNWDGIVDELDLELMDACMGATDDPNLLALDFDWDSWINMPDFGVLAAYYGGTTDPNLPGSYDPNSQWVDFNADGRVDLSDLAVLAELWLVPVFDEYRVCNLCNLHTGSDPNDPNVPGGMHVIDGRDEEVLLEDWGKGFVLNFSALFCEPNGLPVEPNRLSGVVTVQVDQYPETSQSLFLQIDGVPAGEAYPYSSESPAFEIPTHALSNGNHTLTIGGYLSEGGCWMEKIPVKFENRIYLASIPDMYEPNEPYRMTGFYDGETVSVSTDGGGSMTFDDGHVDYNTTISHTGDAQLTVLYASGGDSETQNYTLSESVNMSKVDPNSFRALIIAPYEDVNQAFDVTLTAIRTVLDGKGISRQELLGYNAYWDNIRIALQGGNLNYVFWIGHTNSQIGETRELLTKRVLVEGIHRTNFKCWEKKKFIWTPPEGKIFSCLSSDGLTQPAVLDPLPNDWEICGHSMWSLGLRKTGKIKEFWAIGCESGLEWMNCGKQYDFNDMATAVGAYYTDSKGNHVHVYMGNRIPIWVGKLVNVFYPEAFAHIILSHYSHSLEHAIINGPVGTNEILAVWGKDMDRDGWTDNVLQWWPLDTKLSWIHFY